MMNIVPLNKVKGDVTSLIGSKAASLAKMARTGLPVPPGFCITASAFHRHLELMNLTDNIKASLDNLNSSSEVNAILSGIRQAIITSSLEESLVKEIKDHFDLLKSDMVAIRSSATAEDLPEKSFAGQYDTYLGITNLNGCIEAVKKCWASLWTERAFYYRENNFIDHLKIDMAVIVQSFINADAAGVIFTTDPITGSRSRIIVEACFGLGEAIVSGRVTPDRFIIRKKDFKVTCKRISDKKIKSIVDSHGSIKEEILKDEHSSIQCINDKTAKKLAKFAFRIEKKFGYPQDIEWAVCKNKICFLQARSITVIPQEKSWQDRQIWTNANTGEVIPDVVTPLTWSIIQPSLTEVVNLALDLICINRCNYPLFELVGGRVYVNINTGAGILRCLPFLKNFDFHTIFGGEQSRAAELDQFDLQDEDIPNLKFNLCKMIVKIPTILFQIITYKQKKSEAMIAEVENKLAGIQSLNISSMSEKELAKSIVDDIRRFNKMLADARMQQGILYSFMGFGALKLLNYVCTKWFNNKGINYANSLLAGMGNMDDAEAGLDLWRLAQKAHEIAEIEQAIMSGDDWESTRKRINGILKGEEFLKKWDEFMSRHGHHCRGEMEVFNTRWFEMPDYILSIVRNYIHSIEQSNPLDNYNQRTRQREELEKLCLKELKNPIKRVIFNRLLAQARYFSTVRENTKSDTVRIINIWRNMLLELGRKLYKRGILTDSNDIFFLRIGEIDLVTQNKSDFDIKTTILQRRAEYEKNKSIVLPKVVIGKFNPDNCRPDTVDTNAQLLHGLTVSAGVVTGKARVILKADTSEQVLTGEILVAPFTDPGWTPYFISAAAIVMDQGGLLSHGSIIAREYGIPAVVNVGPATKIIKTGQIIQVDANLGIVKILH